MKQQSQALIEQMNDLVPEALEGFQADGMCEAIENYFNNQSLEPDLSRFANSAQKQAYVKGYTTSLRLQALRIMEAVESLEAVWHYDEEINQNQKEEK
jgi:hypothetical protein